MGLFTTKKKKATVKKEVAPKPAEPKAPALGAIVTTSMNEIVDLSKQVRKHTTPAGEVLAERISAIARQVIALGG